MKTQIGLILLPQLFSVPLALADEATSEHTTFASSKEALSMLRDACAKSDREVLGKLFGPAAAELASGDEAQDAEDLKTFAARLKAGADLQSDGDKRMILYVGAERFPFPVPIVQNAEGKWFFDTESGLDEILNRRIGENELKAMNICLGYVEAQREYGLTDWDGDGVLEYAQVMRSAAGKKDGLFWETKDGENPSPLGSLIANAHLRPVSGSSADAPSEPYYGYLYKIVKAQGEGAPGGAHDYVINGNMVAGFAIIAVPVEWGSSGIMTFLVNANGVVYERDLGEDSAKIAAGMNAYVLDANWKRAEAP